MSKKKMPRVDADNRIDFDKLPKEEGTTYVPDGKETEVSFTDFALAEDELNRLKKEQGHKDPLFVRIVDKYYEKRGERKKHSVNRTVYITLNVLTGVLGFHRFYERRFIIGLIYLTMSIIAFLSSIGYITEGLISLVFIPVSMSVIDWMIVVPMKADEKGRILI